MVLCTRFYNTEIRESFTQETVSIMTEVGKILNIKLKFELSKHNINSLIINKTNYIDLYKNEI